MSAFLIAVAAILWATDTPFRLPAVQALNPIQVVLFEHGIGLIALIIWAILKKRKEVIRLNKTDWLGAILVGGGGSAVATVLFSASFHFINPSLTILLQKLQPVLVIFLAHLFLNEKPKKEFLVWSVIALLAATVLSFPDLNFTFLKQGVDFHSRGILYALGAAFLWAIATISGKYLLGKNSPGTVTFWRYSFGFLTLIGMSLLNHGGNQAESANFFTWTSITSLTTTTLPVLRALLYISFFPGLISMAAYYTGLLKTPASTATLIELLYPVTAVLINTLILQVPLNLVQLAAGTVLLLAVLRISLSNRLK